MAKHKLLSISFVSVVAVVTVHFVASFLYLYWTFWWFDNVSHFLGGLAMGLLTFWVFRRFNDFKEPPSKLKIVTTIFFFVITIGIGWEIFEYIFDLAIVPGGESYWRDTSYDLISDSVGALVASLIIYKNKLHV